MSMTYAILKAVREASVEQLAEVALQMAEVHPDTFVRALNAVQSMESPGRGFSVPPPLGSAQKVEFIVPNNGGTIWLTPAQVVWLSQYTRNEKITCIKKIREFTNLGLKESKDLCEEYFIKRSPHP